MSFKVVGLGEWTCMAHWPVDCIKVFTWVYGHELSLLFSSRSVNVYQLHGARWAVTITFIWFSFFIVIHDLSEH